MIPKPADAEIDAIEAALDAASHDERVAWMRALKKKDMDGLKTLVPLLEGDAARDALPVLRASLTAHADWYASLGSAVETLEAKLGG